MVRIIMNGCNGHMGQVISGLVSEDGGAEIVAGVDVADKGLYTYPVFTDITKCDVQADVMIDFSSAKAVDGVLDFCREKNCLWCFVPQVYLPGSWRKRKKRHRKPQCCARQTCLWELIPC